MLIARCYPRSLRVAWLPPSDAGSAPEANGLSDGLFAPARRLDMTLRECDTARLLSWDRGTLRRAPHRTPHGWSAFHGQPRSAPILRSPGGVEHAASVQRPETQMIDENREDGSHRNWCVLRECFDPTNVEVLQGEQRSACTFEVGFSRPMTNSASSTPRRDASLARVRWGRTTAAVPRFEKEAVDRRPGWTLSQEHRFLTQTAGSQTERRGRVDPPTADSPNRRNPERHCRRWQQLFCQR